MGIRPFYAPGAAADLLPRYSFLEPLLHGRRVLEIGAAAATEGASALYLAEHGAAAVVSVDADAEALARARAECDHPFVQFLQAGIPELARGAFDLVVLADASHLAGHPERVAELKALLARLGVLVAPLPAVGGAGLSALAGTRPPGDGEVPPWGAFIEALTAHFPVVELATQSAMVGWVLGPASEVGREPEVILDGSLAGAPEAAWYLALCGERATRLSGVTLVGLPPRPLADAAVAATEAARASASPPELTALQAEAAELRRALAGRQEDSGEETRARIAAWEARLGEKEARLSEIEAEAASARGRAELLAAEAASERAARREAEQALEARLAGGAERPP
ncbi:MAG TPA: methyltransferase domain-containing protein, partial [Anaeromyxobacteraceae bacterium]|nr:methyltransferase domain-containing protein [Anaeromyxobacteraceae bacterium]